MLRIQDEESNNNNCYVSLPLSLPLKLNVHRVVEAIIVYVS